jgi:hypothetical protein
VGESVSNDGDVWGGHGGFDVWLTKTDANGDLSWQKAIGGSIGDYGYDVEETPGGGYVIAASTSSSDGDLWNIHGGDDAWVVRLDPFGGLLWQRPLGGTADERFFSVALSSEDYLFAGSTNSLNGNVGALHGLVDAWLVRLDPEGDIVWQRTFGGTDTDEAHSLRRTQDGGIIFAGASRSVDGDLTGNHGGLDFWVVKLADPVGIAERSITSFSLAPNPCESVVTLWCDRPPSDGSLVISDISGREILRQRMTGSRHQLDLSRIPSGIYVLTLATEGGTYSQRLVVQ